MNNLRQFNIHKNGTIFRHLKYYKKKFCIYCHTIFLNRYKKAYIQILDFTTKNYTLYCILIHIYVFYVNKMEVNLTFYEKGII